MTFENAYNNTTRAESYAALEFPNTYYLAYRDLPGILNNHVKGKKAIDFGCGTGRSTRFFKDLGYDVIGIDISESMIQKALEFDPEGRYEVVEDGLYFHFGLGHYDLITSIFTFDNIPGLANRTNIIKKLSELLNSTGKLILLDSTPELYTHEWASFSTCQFEENQNAGPGDLVRVHMNDVDDKRPVEDVFWTDADYKHSFLSAGLILEAVYKPLASDKENFSWKNETRIAPWVIYVLAK
jgi:SAM-dependent methyltransferase